MAASENRPETGFFESGQVLFEKLFIFSRDGISVKAGDRWISASEPAAKRMLVSNNQELSGEFVEILIDQRADPKNEAWTIRSDGSHLVADVVLSGVRGPDGHLEKFSQVARDVSDRNRVEASLLVELSNAVLATGDIRQIPSAVEAILCRLVPEAYATIALHDENRAHHLRVRTLSDTSDLEPREEIYLPVEGSPDGWVFTNREPLLMSKLNSELVGEPINQIKAEIRFGCWIPLHRGEEVVGTLFVGSRHELVSEQNILDKIQGLASQIAGAIEIYESFCNILDLSDKLREEKRYLGEELRGELNLEKIVSKSQELTLVLKQVETVAPSDETVLILGEPGTGKDLIARSIHQLSRRHDQPFIKLNCSAAPRGLERKIFGFEKGAFPGATARRIGRLELAHLGTLFLDEIGELPLGLQARLVRALRHKEIQRIGGRKRIPVDVRLVATTNRDLARLVKEGEFDSELYQLLMVNPIKLPPLRRRATDIPLLVNYFVKKHAKRMNKWIDIIPRQTMAALCAGQWPGNERELENFIERAVILTPGSTLHAPLAELQAEEVDAAAPVDPNLEAVERRHILRVLKETKGVVGGPLGAAAKLGLKRTTLNSKLKKLGIQKRGRP